MLINIDVKTSKATIMIKIIETIKSSENGLTNKELANALNQKVSDVTTLTRILCQNKLINRREIRVVSMYGDKTTQYQYYQ